MKISTTVTIVDWIKYSIGSNAQAAISLIIEVLHAPFSLFFYEMNLSLFFSTLDRLIWVCSTSCVMNWVDLNGEAARLIE